LPRQSDLSDDHRPEFQKPQQTSAHDLNGPDAPPYDAKKLARDARRDIFAVADFDGTATSQLGVQPDSSAFRVFVFGRSGELLRQWDDVPSAAELATVVK